MEINNLPVELTVVWNGHFNIDNPAQNKGGDGGAGGGGGEKAENGLLSWAGVLLSPTLVAVPLPLAPNPPPTASPPSPLPCDLLGMGSAWAGGFWGRSGVSRAG